MRRSIAFLVLFGALALVSIGWALSPGLGGPVDRRALAPSPPEIDVAIPDDVPPPTSSEKGDNQGSCRGGCSLAHHPVPDLTAAEFDAAVAAYAEQAPGQASQALETLLFYGARTRELLEQRGTGPLPREHVAFLEEELARETALVTVRMVTETGEERVRIGPTAVPLGKKKHLQASRRIDVQPLEINGTVMRVGLYHLWSRY